MKMSLTWSDVHLMCADIASQLTRNGIKVDVIVPVVRGGMFVGGLLSEQLKVNRVQPIVMQTRDIQESDVDVWRNIRSRYNNILLVDDIVDSGKTFDEILSCDLATGINLCSLVANLDASATRYFRPENVFRSMTINKRYFGSSWITFPWELSDQEQTN